MSERETGESIEARRPWSAPRLQSIAIRETASKSANQSESAGKPNGRFS